jgi:hypothetical protein
MQITRREFLETAAVAGSGLVSLGIPVPAFGDPENERLIGDEALSGTADEIVKEKIRRALLSGPHSVTREATVAEMDSQGKLTVLRPGSNQWVCKGNTSGFIGVVHGEALL